MKKKTNVTKKKATKCLVCKKVFSKQELKKMDETVAEEFKLYPVHEECFDSFVNAEEFLLWAKTANN